MLQAFTALLGALFTVAAAYAAGMLLIVRLRVSLARQEQMPLAFVLGAGCLHLVIFAILALKIATWFVLVSALAAILALAIHIDAWQLRGPSLPPLSRPVKIGFGLIFGAFTLLYFLHGVSPEASPDGSAYHLGFVARYLRAGGFEKITTNMYAGFGGGVDLLFVPAFAIGEHSAAALVHFAFVISLAMMIFAYGRRIGKPWAGALASLLFYLSPVVGIDGTSAYNDIGVAAIVFAVFYWLQLWDEARLARLLIPIGLLAGYGYAAKYTGFILVPYALGYVAWRARKLRPVLMVAACSVPMIAPWMIKNWIYLQNPVAPFANQIFHNPNLHISVEKAWSTWPRTYGLLNMWTLPLEVTVRGDKTNGMVGPIFLLVPLALLALRTQAGRRLLLAALVLLVVYSQNVGTRFLSLSLPFLSLAMALALPEVGLLFAGVAIFHAISCWPSVIPRYADRYCWHIRSFQFEEAVREIPQEVYLRQNNPGYGIARMVEDNVPAGRPVLSEGGISDAYTTHEILVSFQGAFNEALYDTFSMGWRPEAQPTRVKTFRFPPAVVQKLRVLLTASAREFWSVHELRFFRNNVELTPGLQWHVYSSPNPWELQLAFDNSPATRWRSWEPARPGMYIATDFGNVQTIDEIRMETSPEVTPMSFQLESMDNKGQWNRIAVAVTDSEMTPPASLRQSANRKLHEYGVDYVILYDAYPAVGAIHRNPASFGLAEIAQGYGARLFKIIP